MNIKTILLWILTAIFAVLAILFITGPAGVLFLLAAVMAAPIPKLRYWIDEIVAKYGKATLIVIVVAGAILLVPRAEPDGNGGTIQADKDSSETVADTTQSALDETWQTEGTVQTDPQPTVTQTEPDRPTESTEATDVTEATEATDAAEAPTQAPVQLPTEAPTEAPTEPTDAPTEPDSGSLVVVSWPKTIVRGTEGTVTIKGEPNTTYSIKVYYKSGPSAASGLEDKISDADGYVTWTWKVSSRTGTGTFKIVVSGGGETLQVEYSVVDE